MKAVICGAGIAGLTAAHELAERAWRRLAPLLGFPTQPEDPRWPAVAGAVRAIAFTPHRR